MRGRLSPPAILLSVIFLVLWPAISARPCTIAVISGRAVPDGRPLLWKNRDVEEQDNLLKFFKGEKFDYIGLVHVSQTESVWGGLNSAGFALINSASNDLEGESGTDNGRFMKEALERCATVGDFEELLRATNLTGRRTQANYGVIDALGDAAMFEAGNSSHARFDAEAEPMGLVVRTNFALTAARPEKGGGFTRFARGTQLIATGASGGELDARFILKRAARDLVNDVVDPYPLPFEGSQEGHPAGYVRTQYSINRYLTASCFLVQGVRPDEDPRLSVLWCILGEPVCGAALPLWVRAGSVPPELTGYQTAPFRDLVAAMERKCYTDSTSSQYLDTRYLIDSTGSGLLTLTEAVEEVLFLWTEKALESWRAGIPAAEEIRSFQDRLSLLVYQLLWRWSWF